MKKETFNGLSLIIGHNFNISEGGSSWETLCSNTVAAFAEKVSMHRVAHLTTAAGG